MIKVLIKKNKITISGHSGYEESGKDIVCAAVSSTVITSINAILSIDNTSIKVFEGDELSIEILKDIDVVNILLKNMINMLMELEDDYKDYITVKKEE